MAWSNAFIAALGAPVVSPLWRVQPIPTLLSPTTATPLDSHSGLGGNAILTHNVRVLGDGVEPVTWSPTWGGWECEALSVDGSGLRGYVRGMIGQLQLSLDGGVTWVAAALGVLKNVHTKLPVFRLTFAGLGPMLTSRYDFGGVSYGLFANVPTSTAVTVNYTAGGATLTVTSTTGFERESGGSYMIKITQGSVSYYLTASGSTATTFTGCSATGALGSTSQNVTAGATVDSVAYIYGHPLDIARKILASTGAGTNGTYDTLPASWGLGLPDSLLDHIDIARVRSVMTPSSGSWEMFAFSDEAVNDPISWLLTYLNPIAVWPTIRQGLVTFRCAQIPNTARAYQPPWPIDDTMITAGGIEGDYYMDATPVEFYQTQIVDSGGSNTNSPDSPPKTAPASDRFSTTLLGVYANQSAIRAEVAGRTVYWPTRPPEGFQLVCAGLGLWALAPGDLVSLTSNQAVRRQGFLGYAAAGLFLKDYAGLVLNVQPDLAAGTVLLNVACLPELSD